ncbi:MAG: hypothetical protein IKC01_01255 [Clostridia bacterium]|nr:hypothetical protein [Clostridia bacterium]
MEKYFISFADKTNRQINVENENGDIVYTARKTLNLLSEKIILTNVKNEKVAEIRRNISFVLPSYRVSVAEKDTFTVKRKFGFSVAYDVIGLPWMAEADSECENYLVHNNGEPVFEIKKERERWRIGYILCVKSDYDALYGITLSIAIDSAMRAIARVK